MPWFLVSLGSNRPERAACFALAYLALKPVVMAPILLNPDRDGQRPDYWNQVAVIEAIDHLTLEKQIQQLEERCERMRYRPDITLDVDILACQNLEEQLPQGEPKAWHWIQRRLPLTADVLLGLHQLWPEHWPPNTVLFNPKTMAWLMPAEVVPGTILSQVKNDNQSSLHYLS